MTVRLWHRLQHLFEIVVEGRDICSSLFALLILLWIGERVVASDPGWKRWTHRFALAVFFLYVTHRLASELPGDATAVLGVLLRGLLAAAWMLALALVGLPVVAWTWRHTIGGIIGAIQRSIGNRRRKRLEIKSRRAEAEWQAHLRAEEQRLAPIRERQRQEAEQQARAESLRRADEQRRREAVRLDCQLLYDRHRFLLRDRLSSKQFREYFEHYLSDRYAAEEVERRGKQLHDVIAGIVESAGPKKQPYQDLHGLRDYYRGERDAIRASDFPNEVKESLISDLAHEEERAMRALRQR